MDTTNRLFIVLCASAWIVAMAVIIFLTWAAPDRTIDRLGDFVEFLGNNDTDAGKLVVTLAAIAAGILGLLIIVVEVAPDEDPKELRIEQAGATMIVPADALRLRLEEALLNEIPDVTAARSRVWTRDRGVAIDLNLTVAPGGNVAHVTQNAVNVVVDAIQTDLGLPISSVPRVKIAFGGSRVVRPAATVPEPTPVVEPSAPPGAPMSVVQTTDERVSSPPPATTTPVPEASAPINADTPLDPLAYDGTTPASPTTEQPPIEWPQT
jgi:hypothetical protein